MYDRRNERHEFVADTREQAIEKATAFFGGDVDALVIGEFPPGEVYGLGGRAVIVAALRERTRERPAGREAQRDRRDGGSEARSREGRKRRSSPGGADRRDVAADGDAKEPVTHVAEDRQEESIGTPVGDLCELGEFLRGIVERMDVGSFEISESAEENLLVLEIRGNAARKLASGDGRAVDALQLLVNQASARVNTEGPRVVVDVEGNAEAREEYLGRLADRVAGRARKTGRTVALDPMNAKDRRTIHIALRDEEGIATTSIGEGRYRQVLIVPEGAPEYEEAQEQSARSSRGE